MLADRTKPDASKIAELDRLSINTLKVVGVEMVTKAKSGHPGVILSAATILHTLATRHLVYDPDKPKLLNRDRLVLSVGHASGLLYSYLAILGFFSKDELAQFRQFNSPTPGHPEYELERGIEVTTGPLGQGIANGVGLALARAHLNAKFKDFDHYVYVICGDGDLQEGVANEAISFAGTQQLDKLIILYDSNDVQLDTAVSEVVNEDLAKRFTAAGFDYLSAKNTVESIDEAIIKAKSSSKPVIIEVKTIIGEGTPKAGTSAVHGSPLSPAEVTALRESLGHEYPELTIPTEVVSYYRSSLEKNRKAAKRTLSKEFSEFISSSSKMPKNIELKLPKDQATRVVSELVNNKISELLPTYIGGSADLSSSTKIYGADGVFKPANRLGRNILFGVREFAMVAIANGIALHSVLRPFVSTFLVFADYLKPAMRLSAIMGIPVSYIFSHDSVFVGEDGPTHQPIEQLAMIRSIPGIRVLRPGDEVETKAAFELAVASIKKPTVIVTTRQELRSLEETDASSFKRGFYHLRRSQTSRFSLIATGSELALALELGKRLDLNVISASNFCFDQEPLSDPNLTISLEAATSFG